MSYDAIIARSPFIIWQPGGTASGVTVTTWAAVQKFIAAREGAVTVYVDDSITSPAPVPAGTTDCEGRVTFASAVDKIVPAQTAMSLADNAVLLNPAGFDGFLHVICLGASQPNMQLTSGRVVLVQYGAKIDNQGSQPVVSLGADQFGAFVFEVGGSFQANPSQLVDMPVAPAGVFMLVFDNGGFQSSNNVITGVAGTNASLTTDASLANSFIPSNPGFSGTFNVNFVDHAQLVAYSPADPANWSPPPTQVAQALDQLAARSQSAIVTPPPNGSWSQATWFVDPSNVSGFASDSNSGLTALTPVLTYIGGVATKWETFAPILSQQTTLTWMSSQPALSTDYVIFNPIMVGTYAVLQGQLGANQQVHAGVLGAVTPKDRATGQLLEVDLGFAATAGQIVQNTTHASFAIVRKNVAGTVFEMYQPLAAVTLPVSTFVTSPTEVDTWAPGDAITIYQPVSVDIVDITPTIAVPDVADVLPPAVQLYHINPSGGNAPAGYQQVTMGGVAFVESYLSSFVTVAPLSSAYGNILSYNAVASEGLSFSKFDLNSVWQGGGIESGLFLANIGAGVLGSDMIIGGSLNFIFDATVVVEEVYVEGNLTLTGGGTFAATVGSSLIWGSGKLIQFGPGAIFYVSTAVSDFLQAGGFEQNGQTTATSFDYTTGLWITPIPITAVSLDTAIAGGGFGGLATQPGGGPAISSKF